MSTSNASPLASLSAENQLKVPILWMHPIHKSRNGPFPQRFGAPSTQTTDIENLVGVAVTAIQKYSAAFGFRDRRWREEHQISFGDPGLIINALEDVDAERSWQIPLRFSEVTHFKTQAGTLFLLIGLRKMSEQPRIEDLNGPFEEYWIVGVSSDDASEQPTAALPKLLTTMGARGAIRSDLQNSYDISREAIGFGGCASVHLGQARDSAAGNRGKLAQHSTGVVAVKIVTTEFSYTATKEAGFLMGLTCHQNIIGFYGLFIFPHSASDVSRRWAIMMEYCSGGDLHDLIRANGSCSEWRSAEIIFGLFSALSHLHAQGIVHRDVKSENILLMDQGRPVLADFGIAAYLADAKAMTKRCGSPGHCAPEILESRKYNAKVDVFSSGVVLYFLVSGNLPFHGSDMGSVIRRSIRCNVQMRGESFQLVSSTMKALITLFLSKDPEVRPDSSAALHQVILAYSAHLRASSLLLDCATDAPEPDDVRVTLADGTRMAFPTQARTAASPLDTADSLRRPGYMRASEASSYNGDEDASAVRRSFFSFRSAFTPRGTSYAQSSEDPHNASEGPHISVYEDLAVTDAVARGVQGQVMNKSHQPSEYMGRGTSDRSAHDDGAGLSAGVKHLGRPWSSQSQDVPKQPKVEHCFRRRIHMSSVGSERKRPCAENASPKDAAGRDRQADGDNSTASLAWVPHAPPPNGAMRASRRLVPLFKRRQEIAKSEQTITNSAEEQGIALARCGSGVSRQEISAASESGRTSESVYSSASPYWTGSGDFHDRDGAPPCSDDDTVLQELPKDSLVNEHPCVDGASSNLKFPKPSLPTGRRGWWKRHASGKTGTPRQCVPTNSHSPWHD